MFSSKKIWSPKKLHGSSPVLHGKRSKDSTKSKPVLNMRKSLVFAKKQQKTLKNSSFFRVLQWTAFLSTKHGGESVSFACASSPAHNLFFKFVLFPTITFIRLIRFAHGANLRTLCIWNCTGVWSHSLRHKKRAARAPFLWRTGSRCVWTRF